METIKERAEKYMSGNFKGPLGSYIQGATEQNEIIRARLIAMQGEYITLELINELFEDGND